MHDRLLLARRDNVKACRGAAPTLPPARSRAAGASSQAPSRTRLVEAAKTALPRLLRLLGRSPGPALWAMWGMY